MDATIPAAMLVFAVFTVGNLVRYLRGQDWNGAVTIASIWAIASVLAWLYGNSRLGEAWVPPIGTSGLPLGELGFGDFVFVGLFLASTASAFNEFNKARDSTTSVAKPELLSGDTKMILDTPSVIVTDPPPPA